MSKYFCVLFFVGFALFDTPLMGEMQLDEYKKITRDGKVGMAISTTDEVIIEPAYDDIGWSDQSLTVINKVTGYREGERWGLLSVEGKRITQPIFTSIQPLKDNFLIVGLRNNFTILSKYGLINTRGKTVIPAEYQDLSPFQNLLIASKMVDGRSRMGAITLQEKEVIPFEFRTITPIDDALLAVENSAGLKAMFNLAGQQQSGFDFESITPFQPNVFLISFYGRKGLADQNGKAITAPIFEEIRKKRNDEIEGLPFDKWTLLDRQNQILETYYFDKIAPLDEKTLAVQAADKAGIISREKSYLGYFEGMKITSVNDKFATITDGRYFGVINSKGNLLLPIQFDSVKLERNFVWAKINRPNGQSWATYGVSGRKSLNQYESFSEPTDDRILAQRNGKKGLLDLSGNEVSPFLYDSLLRDASGMARVYYQGNYGVINEDGIWVVTPYRDQIEITDKNILFQQGSLSGTMDKNGKTIFRSRAHIVEDPTGFQVIDQENKRQLFDENGQLLMDKKDSIFAVSRDYYGFRLNDQFYIKHLQRPRAVALRKDIQSLGFLEEDLVSVKIDNQYGFIDTKGQLRIANRYDSTLYFSEGLCAVKLIGKWGFINKREEIVIQPSFDEVTSFYGKLSLVRRGDSYGIVDDQGKEVLELKYDRIERKKDHILLTSQKLLGIADRFGSVVRNPQYDTVEQVDEDLFLVSKQGKFGVVSMNGLDVIPIAYRSVLPVGKDFLVLENSQWQEIRLSN